MAEEMINSSYLNEKMTLKLYYPEAFSSLYKYNICIVHDGNDYYQLGKLATLSDQLHSNYDIDNTIFVGIHYQDTFDRLNKYHPDGEQQQAYIKFLVHEVVPLLDAILPTLHMGHSRALMGDSLAGTLALMTALKYPNTFGKVIMQSPYIDESVLDAVKNSNDIHLLDIYQTIGTKETNVTTTSGQVLDFLLSNRKLNEILKTIGVNHYYHELAEGEHTWKYWQKDLSRALTTIFN